jgi:tetratricopeptide (TPR) repeat protein
VAIIAALLVFRPILLKTDFGANSVEVAFAAIYLYVLPALIFFIAYLLLIVREGKITETQLSDKTGALLFCAIAAVALHNLIDFAFFEPGVSTVFWALVACMVAWRLNKNKQTAAIFTIDKTFRISGICLTVICTWAFVHFAVAPPVRASLLQEQAMQSYRSVFKNLSAAGEADPLSTDAVNMYANVLLQQFHGTGRKSPDILNQAVERFTEANKRDIANYSYYEKLSITHNMLASVTTGAAAKENMEKAAFWMDESIKRYPNSARLHIEAANMADSAGKNNKALHHFEKAVEIEDEYRKIFKVMYPDREVFSRLGEDKYQLAKQKIQQLRE